MKFLVYLQNNFMVLLELFLHQVLLTISALHNTCFRYCLVLFVPIGCISYLLESASPVSIVLLLGRFSYQVPLSSPSIFVVIVSATALSYFCHLFTWGNHVLMLSLLLPFCISYFYYPRKSASQIKYSSQVFLTATPLQFLYPYLPHISYFCQVLLSLYYTVAIQATPYSYFYQLLLTTLVSYSYHLLVTGSRCYSLLYKLLLTESATLINQSFQLFFFIFYHIVFSAIPTTIPIRYFY